MSIEIKDINGVVNSLKSYYVSRLSQMSFIMGIKDTSNEYYIYQEILGLPIKRFTCSIADRTFCIAASWQSREHWYSLVKDANDEEIEAWKDLLDNTRTYNRRINRDGITKKDWMIVEKAYKRSYKNFNKKYKLPKTEKFDTFLEMRIPFVKKVNFYQWGFEFISNKMIMIAVDNKIFFPYDVENEKSEKVFVSFFDSRDFDDDDFEDNNSDNIKKESDNIDIYNSFGKENSKNEDDLYKFNRSVTMSWVGGKIVFREDRQEEILETLGMDMISFWNFDSSCTDDFDREIEDIILFGKKEKKDILDIGQRKFDQFNLD